MPKYRVRFWIDEEAKEVLAHELTHALLYECGYKRNGFVLLVNGKLH